MDNDLLDMLEDMAFAAAVLFTASGISLGLVYWLLPLIGVKI